MTTFLQYLVNGLMMGIVYSMIGIGFSLIFGIVRVLNFAYGEFYMIASYVTFFLGVQMGIPVWIIFIIVIVSMFLFGILTDKVLIKPLRENTDEHGEHTGVIIATFGLQTILQAVALLLFGGGYRGAASYTTGRCELGDVIISHERLLMFFVSAVVIIATLAFMKYSKMGRAMRAVSQNRNAALLSGINVNRVYAFSFGLSSALIGIAGALLLPFYSTYPTVGTMPMDKAFATTLMGGLGSIEGAIIAGPLLGVLEALAAGYIGSQTKEAVAFACVIIVLIAFPGGLGEFVKKFSKKGGLKR